MYGGELFTIWLTNNDWDGMPYLYEVCIASWQVMNPKRNVVIYTNNKLHLSLLDRTITEIRQLDEYFPGLYEKAAKLTKNKAHQSDYIRYTILSMQQGLYFDTDILCYRDCEDVINNTLMNCKSVMFPMEDKNMICNAFIGRFSDDGKEVFDDILENYNTRYIKHSYLFNSQKYLWLMSKRHNNHIYLYSDQTIFNPSWKCTDTEYYKMMAYIELEDRVKTLGFDGVGFHLYSSVPEWDDLRKYIDDNMYHKEPRTYISKLTKHVIDQYINLMMEADT